MPMRAGSPCAMSHSRWAIAIRACSKSITVIYRPVYRRYGPRRLRYARDRGTLERRSDRAGTGAFHPDAVEEHHRKSTRSQPTQPSRLGRQNDRSCPQTLQSPSFSTQSPPKLSSRAAQRLAGSGRKRALAGVLSACGLNAGQAGPQISQWHSWSDRDDIRSEKWACSIVVHAPSPPDSVSVTMPA
jgi:hypothetical protein